MNSFRCLQCAMLRAVAPLVAVTFAGCAAAPFTVAWQYSEDEPEFALLERCMADELAVARTTGAAEMSGVISRRKAEAMRRVLEVVEAGDTPTEREYRRAGC